LNHKRTKVVTIIYCLQQIHYQRMHRIFSRNNKTEEA